MADKKVKGEISKEIIKRLQFELEASKKLNHKYFDTLYRLKKIQLKDGKYIVNKEWIIPMD